MTLIDVINNSVKKHESKPALVMRLRYRTIVWTYGDLARYTRSIAGLLEKEGIRSGDRVLLWSPNSPQWVGAFFGILLRGGVVVPIHVENTSEFIKKITKQTGARVILKSSLLKSDFNSNLKTIDINLQSFNKKLPLDILNSPSTKETDLAEIVYTSGTTGNPKGVMLTHGNIVSNVEGLSRAIPASPDDRFLSILPLSHMFEQGAGMLFPISRGARIIYIPRVSSGLITQAMQEHGVTKLLAVPQFLDTVMRKIEARAKEDGKEKLLAATRRIAEHLPFFLRRLLFSKVHKRFGGHLHTIASGGAPLDPLLEKKWELLGIRLLQGYGLTETSPITSVNTYDEHRFSSIGKPLDKVKIKIAPDGEILIKGPNLFRGYYKDEKKTRDAFTPDGRFRTGDMGEFDKDGFLYIRGRKKYMILGPAGQNVYPEDIEFELNKQPGVRDSSVVGLEKDHHVEIHAVLLVEGEVDPEEVIENVNKNLASFQKIQAYSLWPGADFPRSATRKVQKEKVLDWLRNKEGVAKVSQGPVMPLTELLGEIFERKPAEINPKMKLVADLGLDSILRIELVTQIEEKFGVMIDETQITPPCTVSNLEKLIHEARPSEKERRFKNWLLSWWATLNRVLNQTLWIFPVARIFMKLSVGGREHLRNLPLPAIFMPNHMSYLDSLAILIALPLPIRKRIAFAAAKDVVYRQYKSIAWLIELWFNCFPFPRREHEDMRAGLNYMGRMLDKRYSIIVYPEGRMSASGKLQPLKQGAGLIAIEMDSLIVPVKIEGTNTIVPPGKVAPRRRGEVKVTFGKAMKFDRRDSYIHATRKIEQAIRGM